LFDPINLSRDALRRTFSDGFIHFDSRLLVALITAYVDGLRMVKAWLCFNAA